MVRRRLLFVVLGAAALGALASGLLTAAWVHENLSGDFADQVTGELDVGFTALVFLSWAAFIAAPFAIAGAGVVVVWTAVSRRFSPKR